MIVVTIGKGFVMVRFGCLTPTTFYTVLDTFQEAFPSALWDKEIEQWVLGGSHLQSILDFAYNKFKPGQVVVQTESRAEARQLSLF